MGRFAVVAPQPFDIIGAHNPLRNKICHGLQTNYGTLEHSPKAMLAVDIVIRLPGMVRANNIREFHHSRNPKIVEHLNEYDLVKEFGEGVGRIYRDMAEAGLPEPRYRQSDFMLYAELRNGSWEADGAAWDNGVQDGVQDGIQAGVQVGNQELFDKLLAFCSTPKSRNEMMLHVGLKARRNFNDRVLIPLLEKGLIEMTIPDKPTSKNQKYVTVK